MNDSIFILIEDDIVRLKRKKVCSLHHTLQGAQDTAMLKMNVTAQTLWKWIDGDCIPFYENHRGSYHIEEWTIEE